MLLLIALVAPGFVLAVGHAPEIQRAFVVSESDWKDPPAIRSWVGCRNNAGECMMSCPDRWAQWEENSPRCVYESVYNRVGCYCMHVQTAE